MKSLIQLALLIGLVGCAVLKQPGDISSGEADLLGGTERVLPQRFQLHDVPHNPRKQKGTDCAPDSLRMVLNHRGKNVREGDITRQLTSRGRNGGTSFYQMQQVAVKSYGLPAFIVNNCDLLSLKAAIASGWAPIMSYKSSGKSYHAVVAVGYNDKRNILLVHDPNFIRVRKIRYYDLGGVSADSIQRLSCLLVLPSGSTEADLRRGLEEYVPKELSSKLRIFSMLPSQS